MSTEAPKKKILGSKKCKRSWESVIDFTKINKEGVSGHKILAAIKKMRDPTSKF